MRSPPSPVLPVDRRSAELPDRRAAAAGLARGHVRCARPERVAPRGVVPKHADREGSARGLGDALPGEDPVSVLEQANRPGLADLVRVDLVLDLDPAVLRRELQLPVTRTA